MPNSSNIQGIITGVGGVVMSVSSMWFQSRKTKHAMDLAVENAELRTKVINLEAENDRLRGDQ